MESFFTYCILTKCSSKARVRTDLLQILGVVPILGQPSEGMSLVTSIKSHFLP